MFVDLVTRGFPDTALTVAGHVGGGPTTIHMHRPKLVLNSVPGGVITRQEQRVTIAALFTEKRPKVLGSKMTTGPAPAAWPPKNRSGLPSQCNGQGVELFKPLAELEATTRGPGHDHIGRHRSIRLGFRGKSQQDGTRVRWQTVLAAISRRGRQIHVCPVGSEDFPATEPPQPSKQFRHVGCRLIVLLQDGGTRGMIVLTAASLIVSDMLVSEGHTRS